MNDFLTATREPLTSAAQFVTAAGMSSRPFYYAGRPASMDDLPPRRLVNILEQIRTWRGEPAAQAFTETVANMDSLDASNFLSELYALEARGWQSDVSGQNRSPPTAVHAGSSVSSRFFGASADQSAVIREQFLDLVGWQYPADPDRSGSIPPR
jgi:hypothetical protein